MMVQNRPAKESAIKAPNKGMKLAVPLQMVIVLEACTSGMLSSFVRYVIMLEWKPFAANLSHISFAGKQRGQQLVYLAHEFIIIIKIACGIQAYVCVNIYCATKLSSLVQASNTLTSCCESVTYFICWETLGAIWGEWIFAPNLQTIYVVKYPCFETIQQNAYVF